MTSKIWRVPLSSEYFDTLHSTKDHHPFIQPYNIHYIHCVTVTIHLVARQFLYKKSKHRPFCVSVSNYCLWCVELNLP